MSIRLAILGATGLVGQTMLNILQERGDYLDEISLFASSRSAGKEVSFKGKTYPIKELTEEALREEKFDYVLSALDSHLATRYIPVAKEAGAVVIDNSSAYRMAQDVPLVVPEVNPEDAFKNQGIIANPNCSTIQSVVALAPILKTYGLKRIVYVTYQAVSGSGVEGIADLERGIQGQENTLYPHPIAYNILPHIDDFLDTGYTKEEMKMIDESQKIFHLPDLAITATAARVPVKGGHAVAINAETQKPVDLEELRDLYRKTEGIVLQDDPQEKLYPMPLYAEGEDPVFVGRLRLDPSLENGLNLWCVADNIRKGAALNAIQILELLIQKN
ncbi:MAG: aspartate-semialdehyde dehydrogenase [Tissierellia bacterium]|nr:aspartate-semialdehyde dehydrogenase [Tissierellia bacterium]